MPTSLRLFIRTADDDDDDDDDCECDDDDGDDVSLHLNISLHVNVVVFVTSQYSLWLRCTDCIHSSSLLFYTLTSCDSDCDLSPIAQLRPAVTSSPSALSVFVEAVS